MCSFYYFLDIVLFHHDLHHDSCGHYWENCVAILFILNYTFRLSVTKHFWFCKCATPGCFRPWAFSFNIGLNMLPSDSFISCLHSRLGYSTSESQALQLIVHGEFALASCMLVHLFWKNSLKWKWVCKHDTMENNFLDCFILFFHIYLNATQYDNILFSFTLFSCLKYCFIF